MLPTKLGVSPYLLVFKQTPAWLGDLAGRPGGDLGNEGSGDAEDEAQRMLDANLAWWDEALPLVRERLTRLDEITAAQYARRTRGAPDPRFQYHEGDLVMRRVPAVGKLSASADGPFVFARYIGERRVMCEVVGDDGRRWQVAVANLRPLRGDTWTPATGERWQAREQPPQEDAAPVDMWLSSSSSVVDSDDSM